MAAFQFDLGTAARREMVQAGFNPEFPPAARNQVVALKAGRARRADGEFRDLRKLLWSSIDNDTTRDLDQIEFAERVPGGIRILIGIADVDADVVLGSPIDRHASSETTSVYTPVQTFPMLPEELSTDLTSLAEGEDRVAVVVEMLIDGTGSVASSQVYRALVSNKAQLTYSGVGPWLQNGGPPPAKVAGSTDLRQQLELQQEAAAKMREQRHRSGALSFNRVEAQPIVTNGRVQGLKARQKNRANDLIEDFMVGANEVMAQTLKSAGVSSVRRVVKSPDRWPRIVEMASQFGEKLPPEPDSASLSRFLEKRKAADPLHYDDLSLSVIKLMGPGEYVLARPGDPDQGHFGLATHDYTHSTAPNRRFADLVTQRLIKAVLSGGKPPYSDDELGAIARNCTLKEDAARKVERVMNKRVAAVALHDRIGQTFPAVVTGVTPKGVFVRVLDPPAEGRLVRGEQELDVGDQVQVKLLSTDPERGFIDFGR
jgi:VacB/RNase II family 3'-5' exoribonuclease